MVNLRESCEGSFFFTKSVHGNSAKVLGGEVFTTSVQGDSAKMLRGGGVNFQKCSW